MSFVCLLIAVCALIPAVIFTTRQIDMGIVFIIMGSVYMYIIISIKGEIKYYRRINNESNKPNNYYTIEIPKKESDVITIYEEKQ
jgi:hypothetical protein